ncbi:MAG TPA: phosphatase PAP2 family protein [Pyrinomonadaceae bacterium]|nr:phosphatase PAP2 family protein [Pyrinomonadaceae bacterium]
MIYSIALSALFAELTALLTNLNDQMLAGMNGIAGRSWFFDSIVGLTQGNDLIKAGLIGCCFFAAWYSGKTLEDTRARRKVLLMTLVAAVCVLATTKVLSHTIFLPRPAIESQKIYHLSDDNLIAMKRTNVRVPLDEESQKDHRDLVNGDVKTNDLGSFPSDHAGFFLAISLGIFLASRRIGLVAVGWTVFVILAGKMIQAEHSPLDVAAGAAVAITELSVLRMAAQTRLGSILDGVSLWTFKYSALSAALLFAIVFEISSTLFHIRELLALLMAARLHLLAG